MRLYSEREKVNFGRDSGRTYNYLNPNFAHGFQLFRQLIRSGVATKRERLRNVSFTRFPRRRRDKAHGKRTSIRNPEISYPIFLTYT